MKNIAVITTTFALMSYTDIAAANEENLLNCQQVNSLNQPDFPNYTASRRHHHHHHHDSEGPRGPTGPRGPAGPRGPTGATGTGGSGSSGVLGSYYADTISQSGSLQSVVLPTNGSQPFTGAVHFSGVNVNSGVTLALSGNSIVVPTDGNYAIDWNAALLFVQGDSNPPSGWVDFHFDLQKNGIVILSPSPQATGSLSSTSAVINAHSLYTTAAASVIVPLSANDEISLLLTIDGSEGNIAGDGVQIQSAQISATYNAPAP